MKRATIVFTAAITCVNLFAHPASNVTAKFNPDSKILTVKYQHTVKNAEDHYISEVGVYINGNEAVTQKLSLQETLASGELTYKIPDVRSGDQVIVNTKCNKGGSRNYEMKIDKIDVVKNEDIKEKPVKKENAPAPEAPMPQMPPMPR